MFSFPQGLKGIHRIKEMNNKNIYQVIARHFEKTQSKEDELFLKSWMGESDENKILYEKLSAHWNSPVQEKFTILKSEEIKNDIWSRVNNKQAHFKEPEKRKGKHNFLKYAAAILLLVSAGAAIFFQMDHTPPEKKSPSLISRYNAEGRKSEFRLQDGSVIFLNSESSVSFHEAFSDTARIVWLDGEAFFDVAEDSLKPFYVVSENIKIKALGTSFNVNGFSVSEGISVSLASGKVAVINMKKAAVKPVILLPGQQVSYHKKVNSFSPVSEYDRVKVEGWKDGILSFDKADLDEIIQKLNRWYGVDIYVNNKPEDPISYTGTFKRQSLENVLISMGFVNHFDFEINDKTVVLSFQKNK